ncbi:rhomboid-like protein 20 isoform X2 [Physcomitrium patens]|uniref:UBA domain-containing protein n=1 Tax=Physcomitrium patens TaxID=3218 RepID=A0A7I4FIK3_PHYPA|nr:rhomboid-like protein 20 isoform X2 [Physcomitrium patens]|eukprot:XP_024366048.1 rhomboid-like protein 20 isoform X2 [Physcomitrella patens]
MNAGVSGFKNAIVTKGIVVTCGLVSLVLAARGDAKAYNLSYQKIAQRLELWRLVVSPLVFTSLPELLFGLYLLYFFRVFERQAGSIKYLFFVFFTTSVSTFLELVFLFTLKGMFRDGYFGYGPPRVEDGPRVSGKGGDWRLFPASLSWFSDDSSFISSIRLNSGPTGLIFSSFVLFFFDVPVSIRFKLLGIKVSEKSFVYLIGLQLLLWSRMHSMIPGICGIIAGFIYRCDLGGIQEIGFSSGAFRRMAWRVSPFFSGISSEMASRMNNNRASEPVNEPTNRPQENDMPVRAERIFELMAQGHSQKDATMALMLCHNDSRAAHDYLTRK